MLEKLLTLKQIEPYLGENKNTNFRFQSTTPSETIEGQASSITVEIIGARVDAIIIKPISSSARDEFGRIRPLPKTDLIITHPIIYGKSEKDTLLINSGRETIFFSLAQKQ